MKITYLECPDKFKVFSFHRHDMQCHTCPNGEVVCLDGGTDYHKITGKGELKEGEISQLITEIREVFQWGQNYTKDNKRLPETKWQLLKNLSTNHILGILKYFAENLQEDNSIITKDWKIKHLIFIEELLYRQQNQLK